MKKWIALLLLVATLCTLLCGCGPKEWECELCHKMQTGKKYSMVLLGQEIFYCEECNIKNDELYDILY